MAQIIELKLKDYGKADIDLENNAYNRNEWVNYGADNLYPNMLIDFSTYSPTHSALVQLRQNLISANGFVYKEGLGVESFLDNINGSQTADEVLERLAMDISMLETFAVQIIYNRLPEPTIAKVNYIDSSKIRCALVDKKGLIKGYYVCEDWSDTNTYEPIFHPAFDTSKAKSQKSQIYFYRKPTLGQPYYPNVSYVCALNYIALDKQIGVFGFNYVKNGFFSGGIMTYPNEPDPAKQKEIKKKLDENFKGAEEANKMILAFIGADGARIEYVPFSTQDNSGMLNNLNDICVQKIATAHRCNPILAGVDRQGASLGGDKNMLLTALEVYNNTVIYDMQKPILKLFKKILAFNGFSDADLKISDNSLIRRSIADAIYSKVVTIDEAREEGGLEPLPNNEGLKIIEGDIANVFDQPANRF